MKEGTCVESSSDNPGRMQIPISVILKRVKPSALKRKSARMAGGQSEGCSGQHLFTSNQESIQLLW